MVKIVLDAGHGYETPGKRSPAGEREWSFNNKVALAAAAKLNSYENVQILRVDDPTGRTDVALKTRTDRANNWKADVYVAIHHNALTGKWGKHSGIETYTMDHPQANPKSVVLAKEIHPRIVKAMGLQNRGIKRANFHVLRETRMPAILTEGGFMDSTIDIVKLRDDRYLKAQGEAIAEGLAAYFNLRPKMKQPTPPGKEGSDLPDYKKDAQPSKSLAAEVNEAIRLGITDGTYPQRPATREEVAAMIVRAIRLAGL